MAISVELTGQTMKDPAGNFSVQGGKRYRLYESLVDRGTERERNVTVACMVDGNRVRILDKFGHPGIHETTIEGIPAELKEQINRNPLTK